MQRLQLNFMTDGIRSFMNSKHNGDNAQLRIFSFIPQQQRIQPNFMNDSMRELSYIPKFMLLQLRQRKFCSIHIQTLQEIAANFIHFAHHKFCIFH